MNQRFPQITLITINYNGKRFLKPCLDSVFSLNYPKAKLEVILVDNGSKDGSVEFIKKHYPKVRLILNDVNNYCRANNLAIREAKGSYIALINNDVKLDKDWLIELLKVAQSDKKIGAITSKILFADKRLNSTGHVELPNFYWADRGFKEKDRGQYNKLEEIASLSHCACLYKRDCLKDIGLLDEDFVMYLEDVDMSIRIRKKGWKLFYTHHAICYHKFHGSIEQDRLRYYFERNRLFLVAKHYPDKLGRAIFNDGYFSVVGKLNKDFWLSTLEEIKKKRIDKNKEIESLKLQIEQFYKSKIYRFLVHPIRSLTNTKTNIGHPKSKLKILHIIQTYPPEIGGAGMWCQAVCKYLSQNGYKVKVLTMDGSLEDMYRQNQTLTGTDNIEVIRCRKVNSNIIRAIKHLKAYKIYNIIRYIWEKSLGIFFSGSHSIYMYLKMFKEIRNADILHLHIIPYFYNFLGFSLGKLYKKKIFITPYFHRGSQEHERIINFWLMKQCDAVFALTDNEKEYFINKGLDKDKIFVLPYFIDPKDYQPKDLELFKNDLFKRYKIKENTKIVIFIGRKMEYKGIDTLIESIRKLRKDMPIKLFLVGPNFPWFNEYYSKLSEEEKRDIIDFGVVSHQTKVNLLHLSDLLVLPSKFESFGIVFLEARACGLPVIGVEGDNFSSVIGSGGLTVKYGDIDDLAKKIEIILKDPFLADNLTKKGREIKKLAIV